MASNGYVSRHCINVRHSSALPYLRLIGKHLHSGAVSLKMSPSSRGHWTKRAFYFHRGNCCLWGRGPELDQGTSLSGTGHPFHAATTSTAMNLRGGNQPNEVRPTWPSGRENGEKGVGEKKKNMRRKMGIVGLLVNKPAITNKGLSGEAWRVLGVCVCVSHLVAQPGFSPH